MYNNEVLKKIMLNCTTLGIVSHITFFVRRTTEGRGLNLARAVEVAPLIQVPGLYSTTAM